MKHATFVQYGDSSELKGKVQEWIRDNEDKILKVVDIEYTERDSVFIATITYLD